jgi:hypothetical protein
VGSGGEAVGCCGVSIRRSRPCPACLHMLGERPYRGREPYLTITADTRPCVAADASDALPMGGRCAPANRATVQPPSNNRRIRKSHLLVTNITTCINIKQLIWKINTLYNIDLIRHAFNGPDDVFTSTLNPHQTMQQQACRKNNQRPQKRTQSNRLSMDLAKQTIDGCAQKRNTQFHDATKKRQSKVINQKCTSAQTYVYTYLSGLAQPACANNPKSTVGILRGAQARTRNSPAPWAGRQWGGRTGGLQVSWQCGGPCGGLPCRGA